MVNSDINGKWDGSIDTDFGPFEFSVVYKVEGTSISGTFMSEYGTLDFDGGTVLGNSFQYKYLMEGAEIEHKGTLINKDEILIKWTSPQFGEGEFTFKRAEE